MGKRGGMTNTAMNAGGSGMWSGSQIRSSDANLKYEKLNIIH